MARAIVIPLYDRPGDEGAGEILEILAELGLSHEPYYAELPELPPPVELHSVRAELHPPHRPAMLERDECESDDPGYVPTLEDAMDHGHGGGDPDEGWE